MIVRNVMMLVSLAFCSVAAAGDHFYYAAPTPMYHLPSVSYYSPAVVHVAPAPSVFVTPVAYVAPVVAYRPAYVVPTTVVASYPHASYVQTQVYAPMVPTFAAPRYAVGYYPAIPRPVLAAPVVYSRHGRPRDVEIELKYRRDGGYRYEIDFD